MISVPRSRGLRWRQGHSSVVDNEGVTWMGVLEIIVPVLLIVAVIAVVAVVVDRRRGPREHRRP